MQRLKQKPRTSTSSIPSIFDLLLTPDPKKNRPVPSDDALTAEGVLMLAAGMDTTANALRVGTWHVLSDPRVYRKLKEELRDAILHRDEIVDSATLENLPYLVRHATPFLVHGLVGAWTNGICLVWCRERESSAFLRRPRAPSASCPSFWCRNLWLAGARRRKSHSPPFLKIERHCTLN
jgi:hypothetical protein